MVTRKKSNIWREIIPIPFHNFEHLRSRLYDDGYKITKKAKELFEEVSFNDPVDQKKVALIVLSAIDLGFKSYDRNINFYHIISAAKEKGLSLCPEELVATIRLNYCGPKPERIYVGMNPIDKMIFSLINDRGGEFVHAYKVSKNNFRASDRFIFIVDK